MNHDLRIYRRLGMERIEDRLMLSAAPPAALDARLPDFYLAAPMPDRFVEVPAHVVDIPAARQPIQQDALPPVSRPATGSPSSDGGFIGIDQPFLRSRAVTLSTDTFQDSATDLTRPERRSAAPLTRSAGTFQSTAPLSRTARAPDVGEPADESSSRAVQALADHAGPSHAAPPRQPESGETSQESADRPEPPALVDCIPLVAESEWGRPSDHRLTAISPSAWVLEEPEGGLIDLTALANTTARRYPPTAVASPIANAAAAVADVADEESALDGLRGRFQVFELALAAGSLPDPEEVPSFSQEPTTSETPPARLTSLRPPAEHGASYQFRARDEAFAQLAERPKQHQASAENDVHWSLGRILLFGGAVVGLHAAERNAHAAAVPDRQPVSVAWPGRNGHR